MDPLGSQAGPNVWMNGQEHQMDPVQGTLGSHFPGSASSHPRVQLSHLPTQTTHAAPVHTIVPSQFSSQAGPNVRMSGQEHQMGPLGSTIVPSLPPAAISLGEKWLIDFDDVAPVPALSSPFDKMVEGEMSGGKCQL